MDEGESRRYRECRRTAGDWPSLDGSVDIGLHMVSGIHNSLLDTSWGSALGIPSGPRHNRTPFTQEKIQAQKPVSYSKLSFLVRPIPAHFFLALSLPFYDL